MLIEKIAEKWNIFFLNLYETYKEILYHIIKLPKWKIKGHNPINLVKKFIFIEVSRFDLMTISPRRMSLENLIIYIIFV